MKNITWDRVNQSGKILVQIIIILLLILLLWKQSKTDKQLGEYWQKKSFRTDTVIVATIDYTKIKLPEYKYPVPPAFVFDYSKIPPSVDYTRIVMNDSLLQVIDSLKRKLTTININYLKIEPTKPKLLYGEFEFDSLRLDLLGIDGHINSQRYSTNYLKFNYQWKDGELRATALKRELLKPKLITQGSYAFGGYDLTNKAFILGADYSLYMKRLRFSADSWVTLENQPNFFFQGKVGYKLR